MPGTKSKHSSRFRIGRGAWRSRVIAFHHAPDLRPTLARVREAAFGMLAGFADSHGFLDAFAGSGIMALEAASMGFDPILCCETHRPSLRQIEANFETLGGQARFSSLPASKLSEGALLGSPWVIYADPPFGQRDAHQQLLAQLSLRTDLAEGSIYVAESEDASPAEPPAPWSTWKRRRYGRIHLWLGTKDA